MDIKKLKKEMLAELDPQAKKEYAPLIRSIKSETDAKAVCSRMGLSTTHQSEIITMNAKNPPPKGTPLRHIATDAIYYSTGTTNNLDRLYCDSSPNASEQEFMFPFESLQPVAPQELQEIRLSNTNDNFQDKIIDFLKENLKIRIESDSHGGPRTEHEIQLLINDQIICSTYLP